MLHFFLYFLFFVNNNVNSYSRFFPRLFSQKKRFTTTAVYNDIPSQYYNIVDDNITAIYNNNTERIQKFIEYMKLKTFEDNGMEDIWDSGEIEWEF